MKLGFLGFIALLASCVVPLDSANLIAKETPALVVSKPINIVSTPSEFYPQLERPCRKDYSSMSLQSEYLAKLDCALEIKGG